MLISQSPSRLVCYARLLFTTWMLREFTREHFKKRNSIERKTPYNIIRNSQLWLIEWCFGQIKVSSIYLFVFHRKRRRPRMAYGACYLKGTRFFDRGGMIAGPSLRPLAYWDSCLRALPALYNKEFRLGPGKRWQQQKGRGPCSCCARPLLSQWGSRFGIY